MWRTKRTSILKAMELMYFHSVHTIDPVNLRIVHEFEQTLAIQNN